MVKMVEMKHLYNFHMVEISYFERIIVKVFQEHISSACIAQKREKISSLNISHVMSIVYASDYKGGEEKGGVNNVEEKVMNNFFLFKEAAVGKKLR